MIRELAMPALKNAENTQIYPIPRDQFREFMFLRWNAGNKAIPPGLKGSVRDGPSLSNVRNNTKGRPKYGSLCTRPLCQRIPDG